MLQDWVCGELYVNLNEDIFLEIYFQTWKKTLEAICSALIFYGLGNRSPEKYRHVSLWQIATLFPNSFFRASEAAPLCCTAPRAWFTQTAVTQFSMHNVWGVVFIKFWVQNFDYLLFVAINYQGEFRKPFHRECLLSFSTCGAKLDKVLSKASSAWLPR